MATALGLDVSELGEAEDSSQMQTISSMCTVFAESEIIGSLARGNPKGGIIAGLHQSIGKRVAAMVRRMSGLFFVERKAAGWRGDQHV